MEIKKNNNSLYVKLMYDDFCEYNIWPDELNDPEYIRSSEFHNAMMEIIHKVMTEESDGEYDMATLGITLSLVGKDSIVLKIDIMNTYDSSNQSVPVLPSGFADFSSILSKILGGDLSQLDFEKVGDNEKKNNKKMSPEDGEQKVLVEFSSFRQMLDYVEILMTYTKESAVIKYKDKYYVVLKTDNVKSLENTVCEFCLKIHKDNSVDFIAEHAEIILEENALPQLMKIVNPD